MASGTPIRQRRPIELTRLIVSGRRPVVNAGRCPGPRRLPRPRAEAAPTAGGGNP